MINFIPAHPGYFALEVSSQAPEYEVFSTPIIGWKYESGDEYADPVGFDPILEPYGILDPQGAVTMPGHTTYPDQASFRSAMIDEMNRKKSPRG